MVVLQVLAEGSQMRKEADDTGPLAELEYWKQRTAKFSCLVDQIKSQPCKGVITTLVAAKSKVIKVREEYQCRSEVRKYTCEETISCGIWHLTKSPYYQTFSFRYGVSLMDTSQMPQMRQKTTSSTCTPWSSSASHSIRVTLWACWSPFPASSPPYRWCMLSPATTTLLRE